MEYGFNKQLLHSNSHILKQTPTPNQILQRSGGELQPFSADGGASQATTTNAHPSHWLCRPLHWKAWWGDGCDRCTVLTRVCGCRRRIAGAGAVLEPLAELATGFTLPSVDACCSLAPRCCAGVPRALCGVQ